MGVRSRSPPRIGASAAPSRTAGLRVMLKTAALVWRHEPGDTAGFPSRQAAPSPEGQGGRGEGAMRKPGYLTTPDDRRGPEAIGKALRNNSQRIDRQRIMAELAHLFTYGTRLGSSVSDARRE